MTRTFGGAFDTVFDSGRIFRVLLEAASNPGKLFTLPPFDEVKLEESVLLTLLDHEASFHILGGEAGIGEKLSRATGARLDPLDEADFALIHPPCAAISEMKRGTLEKPELGATAVYVVEELSNSGTLTLKLYGPGVPGERTLGVEGLPASEVRKIRESRAEYPLGVDVYFVDGAGRMCGLPRSTRMEVV